MFKFYRCSVHADIFWVLGHVPNTTIEGMSWPQGAYHLQPKPFWNTSEEWLTADQVERVKQDVQRCIEHVNSIDNTLGRYYEVYSLANDINIRFFITNAPNNYDQAGTVEVGSIVCRTDKGDVPFRIVAITDHSVATQVKRYASGIFRYYEISRTNLLERWNTKDGPVIVDTNFEVIPSI